MEMIDKLNASARQATKGARESVREAQLRQDLDRAYNQLGHVTYELVERGALADPRLTSSAERVRTIERGLAAITSAGPSAPISA